MNLNYSSFKTIIPLSIQHLLAMFVGTIVPPLLLANVANIHGEGSTILIQAALFSAGIATFIQLFPISFLKKYKTGSSLPIMMGMNYVFLGVSLTVAGKYGLPLLFGGLIISSFISIFLMQYIGILKKFFTPLVSGILVICMGIGLFQPAIHNLAGDLGSPNYGKPVNFIIGLFVAFLIVFLNKFGRGKIKDISILIGIIVGYIICFPLGMIDYSQFKEASWFSIPKVLNYGFDFNFEVIFIFLVTYIISTIDFMGCCTVTTIGGYNRELKDEEYVSGLIGSSIGSVLAGLFGSIPVAGLSQNAAIVAMNKGTNRKIFIFAGILVLLTSISPKLASILITIPSAVIGGATLVVFGMIASSGIMLLTLCDFDSEKRLITGVAIATSVGISNNPGILSQFPLMFQTMIEGSSIISAVIIALILQAIFSLDKKQNLK
jgi:uracil-xanthine permease